jgi:hypothetical protein
VQRRRIGSRASHRFVDQLMHVAFHDHDFTGPEACERSMGNASRYSWQLTCPSERQPRSLEREGAVSKTHPGSLCKCCTWSSPEVTGPPTPTRCHPEPTSKMRSRRIRCAPPRAHSSEGSWCMYLPPLRIPIRAGRTWFEFFSVITSRVGSRSVTAQALQFSLQSTRIEYNGGSSRSTSHITSSIWVLRV